MERETVSEKVNATQAIREGGFIIIMERDLFIDILYRQRLVNNFLPEEV